MMYVIAILSVIFLGLAAMVVSRMAAVVKNANGASEGEFSITSNRINGVLFLIFFVLGIIGFIWSFLYARQFFLPEASSPHGRRTDFLFWLSMGVITFAFVATNDFYSFLLGNTNIKKAEEQLTTLRITNSN